MEQQAAQRAGLRAYEMERHAQTQTADFNQREAQFREEWMVVRQECAKLTKDKDTLTMDLAACQDTIHEESQAYHQLQRHLAERPTLPQLADDSQARRERSEWGAVGVGDAVDHCDDGRSLRQSTVAGTAREGGRPSRDVDPGYGHPVASAVGRPADEGCSYLPESSDVRPSA